MAAPAWATNLTDIYVGGAGNFTALGGGQAGLNIETDYFIQGTDCQSKNAWAAAIKGMIHDHGAAFTVPTTGAIIAWLYYAAVGSLEVKDPGGSPSNGGMMLVEGSGSGNRNRYNVGGKDTLTFDSWVPYVVDPNTATPDDTVGTPSGTEQWVGVECNLPGAGPTKGSPCGIDAVRYGRCDIEYTAGDLGNGYNTFLGAEAYGNAVARRWGVIEFRQGAYYIQGFHSLGLSGTAVDFRDSNKVIFIRDTPYVASGFNRIEILNASSNVDWTNIIFQSLSAQSRGTFVVTAGAFDAVACQFIEMGTLTFLASSNVTACIIRKCLAVTAPGTDLTDTKILESAVAIDVAALIWNVVTDPDGNLDDMEFSKGAASHHAIEFSGAAPATMTLRGIDFSGFNASNGATDSTLYFPDSGSDVDWVVNLVGCTGNISYKKVRAGDTVTLVIDPVTTMVTVKDSGGALIQGARVLLLASDGTGALPYEESVTLTAAGTAATVAHTAHGMKTGDFVLIEGADQQAYNGTFEIIVTGVNGYTYDMQTSPVPTATGTITATGGLFNTLTGATGILTDSRSILADQPVRGRVRKSTSAPFYKTQPLVGTIDAANGLDLTAFLALDQ